MATVREIAGDMKSVPITLCFIALFLVIDGALALLGCVVYPGSLAERLYDGIGSIIILGTGLMIFINHRSALCFSLMCAVLLTVDQIREFIVAPPANWSIHALGKAAHVVLNIVFYWISYILYRRWTRASHVTGNGAVCD